MLVQNVLPIYSDSLASLFYVSLYCDLTYRNKSDIIGDSWNQIKLAIFCILCKMSKSNFRALCSLKSIICFRPNLTDFQEVKPTFPLAQVSVSTVETLV